MRIAIANPLRCGAKKMSASRAQGLVKRGIARWLPDGKIFINEQSRNERHASNLRQTVAERRGSDVYVQSNFSICIVNSRSFPHTQWICGEAPRHGSFRPENRGRVGRWHNVASHGVKIGVYGLTG